jgi:aspartate/methionine/tyrosine aminotransferase
MLWTKELVPGMTDTFVLAKQRDRLVSNRGSSIPPSKIRRMFNRAATMPDVVNLAVGQPDFDTPPHIIAAAERAMARGFTRYTYGLGIPELRTAIADKVQRRNRLPIDQEWVGVTVGAMEALILAMLTTLDPGDEVLIPNPGYTNFEGQLLLAGAVPVSYPLSPPDYAVDAATLAPLVTDRTRAILICSPSNPTGAVLSPKSLATVASVAREHGLLVFSDETYEDLVYEGRHHSIAALPDMAERTVSVFSFSKTYAMTGWRVGYLVAPPPLLVAMNVLQEHIVSCPSSVSQYAALAALTESQDCVVEMCAAYDERRRFIVAALNGLPGFSCPMPHGAFYAFADISGLDTPSDAFADWLLQEAHVALVPGNAFNTRGEGFVRLSYAASVSNLQEAVDRIAAALGRRQLVTMAT